MKERRKGKDWRKSNTLWLNVMATLITIVQLLQGFAWFPAQYQVLVLAILNAIVRIWLTSQPIRKTGS